jgi:hypothetical protein
MERLSINSEINQIYYSGISISTNNGSYRRDSVYDMLNDIDDYNGSKSPRSKYVYHRILEINTPLKRLVEVTKWLYIEYDLNEKLMELNKLDKDLGYENYCQMKRCRKLNRCGFTLHRKKLQILQLNDEMNKLRNDWNIVKKEIEQLKVMVQYIQGKINLYSHNLTDKIFN